MDTVVITLFLITQFYVCKMDADYRERRRSIPQREKRWSMNSQRLEEIVAELMKPISDVRRSFDTDLSALLEEYLTEAGLHALDAEEEEINSTIPNFAELALLLQQSASIYSRKVDFLYQHVLSVSESLQNNTQEAEASGGAADEPAAAGARRRRRPSAREPFAAVELEASAGARREAGARPPPTLPPLYVELEPRVLAPSDVPLHDYAGEPIGLLADFHVAWRLQDGLLVEELAGGSTGESTLRALPLTELQAAIAAAAPPSPPPCRPPSPPTPPSSPGVPVCSTPLPVELPSNPALLAPPTPLAVLEKKERKRRSDVDVEHPEGPIKLIMNKKLRRRLQRVEEFSVPEQWVSRVVRMRVAALRAARCALAARSPPALTGSV
ncbi:unnamed protein product [Euphydryas editha]|uniref:Condensin II complex subunit H2 N-terminal domain-containing protein n=1 Tax=Euphydryas editha TaxID=104508 RepID=A0AAU9THY7_EUPED|nr:unnamed protein product [Euphydryas editha]